MRTSRATRWRLRGTAVGLAIAGLAAPLSTTAEAATAPGAPVVSDWASAGQNTADTHYAATEKTIGTGNVAQLQPRWTFTTGGDVSAIPTVVKGVVYTPDWDGNLFAVNAATGRALWTKRISDYTGVSGDLSRLSPAYWDGELITGDGATDVHSSEGAYVFGVDAATGGARWKTLVDDDPAAITTGSAVVSDGVAYVGVSSKAETLPGAPTFRGSMVALDAATGKLLWKTYTVPQGYTGGAIWGSSPVVDAKTGLVYAGIGNNYTTPDGVCTTPDQTGCTPPSPDDHFDSIVAFDHKTGAIAWATPTLTADTWTIAKQFGPDFDFGTSPNLYTTTINGTPTELLGIGQKSGVYWALDPATGKIVWRTAVGPGGGLGGMEWSTATDGNRIYLSDTNFGRIPTTITSATGQKSTTDGGFFAALDAATGKVLWQTADPQNGLLDSFISAANGVMYGGTLTPTGKNMYALDGATGTVKWSFASGGSVVGGPAIVDGSLYWGSGYNSQKFGLPINGHNNKLYAFSIPQPPAAPQAVYVSPTGTASAADTSCNTAAFTSINTAIRAVASGGRVIACGGTYKEDVAVTKPLSLEVNGNVIIDATGLVNGIEVAAPNVTVSGFTINNAMGEGIIVKGVDNVTVANNIVSENDKGTGTTSYGQCATINSHPGDCGGGIHLMGSSNSKVLNNTSRANTAGIVISDESGPATHNQVSGNSVQDNPNGDGITLAGRNSTAAPGGTPAPSAAGVFDNTIGSNTITGNGLTAGGGGVTLTSAVAGGAVYGNTVSGNVLSGNAHAGVTVHSLASGQDFNGNIINGTNTISTNNTKGDATASVTDSETTAVVVTSVGPLSIQVTGNNIANDHFGVWTLGPVTAQGATNNNFSGVAVTISNN
jgi:polyvinyl alcohol dehydrogenase (cytochrome)